MDILRAFVLVALASTPALADSSEAEDVPQTYALGIGSSFAGQPVLVSQQWRSERAGIHYTFRFKWDHASVMDSSTNVYAFEIGTYFLFNIAQTGRTRALLMAGGEGAAISAGGVRGGSALFALGIQVQRRVTDTLGIYAQTGVSVGIETRAAQILADGIDPGEDAMRVTVRATPLDLVSTLGLLWWLN